MARKQNLPLPASTRDNGQQSRTRSALAVGAMLCMAAAIGGTALAMRGSGTELASSQSPMTSYEQPNTHMRRDKIMDAMMGKINGLDIKANPNAAGANSGSDSGNHGKDGKPQDFKPKETQTEQEPPAPVVTDEHGDEVAQVETAQQVRVFSCCFVILDCSGCGLHFAVYILRFAERLCTTCRVQARGRV